MIGLSAMCFWMISVVVIVFRVPAALCCSAGPCRVCSRGPCAAVIKLTGCVQLEVMNYTLILLIYSSTAGYPNQSKQTRSCCKCTCVWVGMNLWWSCSSSCSLFLPLSCPDGVCPRPPGRLTSSTVAICRAQMRLLVCLTRLEWEWNEYKFNWVLICGSREPTQWCDDAVSVWCQWLSGHGHSDVIMSCQ